MDRLVAAIDAGITLLDTAVASLRRLKGDVIDLDQLHRVDPRTPVEDSVKALADLVGEGQLRYVCLSKVSADMPRPARRSCSRPTTLPGSRQHSRGAPCDQAPNGSLRAMVSSLRDPMLTSTTGQPASRSIRSMYLRAASGRAERVRAEDRSASQPGSDS
jgi:aldo/keto reductase family protein